MIKSSKSQALINRLSQVVQSTSKIKSLLSRYDEYSEEQMNLLEEQLYSLSETYAMIIEYLDDVMKEISFNRENLYVIK